MHADDTDLFAKNKLDLKRIIENFVEVCRRRGMKVNVNKSKAMVVGIIFITECEA